MEICNVVFAIESISDFLVFPTNCFYHFWLLVFGFLFLLLTYMFYEKDEQKKSEGEIISSLGVSSITVTILALIGTFVKSTQDVPMIQNDIFLFILAPAIVFIGLWIFTK